MDAVEGTSLVFFIVGFMMTSGGGGKDATPEDATAVAGAKIGASGLAAPKQRNEAAPGI
jgi:hypothetical protein